MRVFDCGLKTRALETVVFASNGGLLAAGSADCRPAIVWDVATGAERARFAHGRFDNIPVQFRAGDGHLLLSTHAGWMVGDPATGAVRSALDASWRGGALAAAPEGDWTVYWHEYARTRPTELHAAAHFGSPAEVALWSAPVGGPSDVQVSVQLLAFLPGAERFLSAEWWYRMGAAGGTRRLTVRARSDGRPLKAAEHPADWGDRAYASPASEAVVVRSGIWLRVYAADELDAPPRVLKNDNRKHFTGIAFHPSGRYLAATSNDATVKLYDTATWEVARTFTWNIGKMRSVAFSPDGTLAAAGSDTGKVVVWDVDL